MKTIVIGAGFYGCSLALHFASKGHEVILLESEGEIMSKASYNNQARVHGGYHYSRSFLTANRSRKNYERFMGEFSEAIVSDFSHIYCIARNFSQISAHQFASFCHRIGAPIEKAPKSVSALFDQSLIEDAYLVQEYAFDSLQLKRKMQAKLAISGVQLQTKAQAHKVASLGPKQGLLVSVGEAPETCPEICEEIECQQVIMATYSQINHLLKSSQLELIPLKHEWTEMALVKMPEVLSKFGVTIMDGPFWSCMPFPSRALNTLSHVRYTPHFSWEEKQGEDIPDSLGDFARESNFLKMIKDASRFLPLIGRSEYVDSLWEVKTILPRSENNDSRPILFRRNHGLANFHIVLGGKIDNIFDIIESFEDLP
jgi:glycine/D-amino acid oxidase-like deaminating enzyme